MPYAIENGLKKEAADLTAKLLQETEAMNIVNDMLIPALDKAGAEFERVSFSCRSLSRQQALHRLALR